MELLSVCKNCAVCILMFTISSTRAESVNNTDQNGVFDVDGVGRLGAFEAISHFLDFQRERNDDARRIDGNLPGHVLIDIWWERFNCSVIKQSSQHSQNDHDNCKQCLNETTLFTTLKEDQSEGISEEVLTQLSTILLFYTLNLKSACAKNTPTIDLKIYAPTYQQIVDQLIATSQTWRQEDIEEILVSLSRFYTPITHSKCFTAQDVQSSSSHQPQESVESASSLIVTNLILGRCIGKPTVTDQQAFLREVFKQFGNNHGIITEKGFEKLLADLGIGAEQPEDEEDEDYTDAYENLERRKRADDSEENDALTVQQCFTGEDLLDIYDIDVQESGINGPAFQEICPALIQQISSGVCQEENDGHDDTTSKLTIGEVWGYGFLAVFVISLVNFAGVAVLPCLRSSLYEHAIQMLIALAVATLSGDAILHLIPQALGLHNHGHGHRHGGGHGPLSAELAYIWKCLVAYLVVYLFFLFESMVEMCGGAHTHEHMEHKSLMLQDIQPGDKEGATPLPPASPDSISRRKSAKTGVEEEVGIHHQHNHGCFGKGALPIMVVLGDTLHNFVDGLAIGAAFYSGTASGVSTSIAIFCHELPHELGDFAVLINAGINYKMALLLNFVSGLSAVLGLVVGTLVSVETSAREWIFAAAAGTFLYVSLVDMMPELIHHHGNKGQSRSLLFILQNVGLLLGAAIILVIALFEDSLVVNF